MMNTTPSQTKTEIKVGDKLTLPASYRGSAIPPTEWTVVKENKKSFLVFGTVNAGKPNWAQYNLYLKKSTGRISD